MRPIESGKFTTADLELTPDDDDVFEAEVPFAVKVVPSELIR